MSDPLSNSSVAPEDQDVEHQGKKVTENLSPEVVPYDTHRRLLDQRKKDTVRFQEIETKLKQYEQKEQQSVEQEAEAKGEYTKILGSYKQQIEDLKSRNTSYEKNLIDGQKLQSVLDRLPGKVKKQEFMSFIDLDSIVIDPSNGAIDDHSLDTTVNKFVKDYHDLIQFNNDKRIPNVSNLGHAPYAARSLKNLTREEMKQAYNNGKFKQD